MPGESSAEHDSQAETLGVAIAIGFQLIFQIVDVGKKTSAHRKRFHTTKYMNTDRIQQFLVGLSSMYGLYLVM